MLEPFSLTVAIIGLISSSLIIFVLGFTIIKNGKDVTESLVQCMRDRKNKSETIPKLDLNGFISSTFISVCSLFDEYKKKINCKEWVLITICDSKGQPKTFNVPKPGKLIELELKDKIYISVLILGAMNLEGVTINGFKVYYKKDNNFRVFIEGLKYISDEEKNRILGKTQNEKKTEKFVDNSMENGLMMQGLLNDSRKTR